MDGSQEFASKIAWIENEITALKTNNVKSSSQISTEEKTARVNIHTNDYGYGNTTITLTPKNSDYMLSQIYLDGFGVEAGIARIDWNKYNVGISNQANNANVGFNVVMIATDDFDYRIGG